MDIVGLPGVGTKGGIVRQLLDDAYVAYDDAVGDRVRIYTPQYDGWRSQGFVRPRTLESVILPAGFKEDLHQDMLKFLDREPWYHSLGIPYRRGYLLHGVPGSGKSSLVAALANTVDMPLYVINVAALSTDSSLEESLQNIPSARAIVLFEDIDCARAARNREDGGGDGSVTVSGLLNLLDGVTSRDGCITFLTTNHRDALDPALVRPGRVDREVEFRHATVEQAQELYRRFYGDDVYEQYGQHLRVSSECSMAQIQGHFMAQLGNPEAGAHVGVRPRLVEVG